MALNGMIPSSGGNLKLQCAFELFTENYLYMKIVGKSFPCGVCTTRSSTARFEADVTHTRSPTISQLVPSCLSYLQIANN